jgi:arylsulfatase A
VYLPLTGIHHPIEPPKRFAGKSGDGGRGDLCLWLDECVGRILDTLDRLKLADNTLVFFASDNGSYFIGDRSSWTSSTGHRPSGPYRGYKTDIWEGGTRVPFLARWPGRIPAAAKSDHLLCLNDMLATFAGLHGVKLPEHAGEDSINQLSALLGRSQGENRQDLVTHSYTGVFAVRQGHWKLILDTEGSGGHRGSTPGWAPIVRGLPEAPGTGGAGQLYNLADDPQETNNLWQHQPEVAERLRRLLLEQLESGRSRPT